MLVGVPKENTPDEKRVALVPELVPALKRAGLEILIQPGAGAEAGFSDTAYQEKSARLEAGILTAADIFLKVRPPTLQEASDIKEGSILISFLEPYTQQDMIQRLAERRITAFAMELIPRITRAQPMDALSAMSTVAGYKAVLLAAGRLPRFFPLLMTAAGTITPARVFVLGTGVAGLQAIATAKRLGAVVEAYDTRPAVKKQVQSLGARFVELPLETGKAEEQTGYAKAQSEDFYRKQQELLAKTVAAADVVITTALVPGKRAPVLISAEMVQAMRPGSVIVDLAAEQGGNCAVTEPGKEVVRNGVTILGFTNLPSTLAFHASQMYARTVVNLVLALVRDGKVNLDLQDELIRGALVTHGGEIVHESIRAKPKEGSFTS